MDALTGRAAKRQYDLAVAAQEQQASLQSAANATAQKAQMTAAEAQLTQAKAVAEEKARVKEVADSQQRLYTGGRGMLAFIDDSKDKLKQTFGGS